MEQGEGLLALSQRDRDRLRELHGVIRGQQGLRDAAEHLGLSTKQARRLLERVAEEGDREVIHRLRGVPSNRTIPARVRTKAVKRLGREEYHGFGPTLAAEHLERIDIYVSRETVVDEGSGAMEAALSQGEVRSCLAREAGGLR